MTTVQLPQPDLLVDAANEVGEGPLIDPRDGALTWVDITRGSLHTYDLDTAQLSTTVVPMMLGAVAARASSSGFGAAVADGFALIDQGALVMRDRCLPDPGVRMNDAKCDPAGRMWAGSCSLTVEQGRGRLHRWDGQNPSEVIVDGLTLPNGIGWSPDARRFYFIDTMKHTVFVADFDVDDGAIGALTPWARVESGLPDGLAVDTDGCVWVAVWGGGEVLRFSPDGAVVARVPMPVTQPSSCALSADGTLYITSARLGLGDDELVDQPHAGGLFAVSVGVGGVPVAGLGA